MRSDIELLTQTTNVVTQTADIIVQYGFLGVGLVLTLLIAPAIHKWTKAPRIGLGALCFGLAFIIAYGVINIISVVAPTWISAQRAMISGFVLGVPNGQQVQMRSNLWRAGHAYTKREFDPQRGNIFNFPFLLVTAHPPTCLAVALVSTDPNSDNSPVFNVTPISSDDMAPNMEILAELSGAPDKPALKVWRELNAKQMGKASVFQPLSSTDPGCAPVRGRLQVWSVFGRAFAQASVSDSEIIQRLQSDDVFTRRDARIALSKKGEDGFELIGKLLARDDNYRLQLGAAVALSGMPDEQRKKAPSDLFKKLNALQSSKDKTMRETVAQALR